VTPINDYDKIEPPFEYKYLHERIEINEKQFPPCNAKIEDEWNYKQLKNVKYVVHVHKDGKITRRKLTS
jgi:hypothetical protein